MRRLAFALLLALLPLAARAADDTVTNTARPDALPAAKVDDAEARYQQLLAAAKTAAPDADWQGLRVAFAERPAFRNYGQGVAKNEMFKAVEAGDCASAVREAKAVIAEAFIDADAHLVTAYCDDKLGDTADATWERDVGVGLLKSIQTGDGHSTASPFTVIDVDEEYSLLRAMGLQMTKQALVQQDGHSYDALSTTNAKGETATYYFLIDRVLAAEAAALKEGAAQP